MPNRIDRIEQAQMEAAYGTYRSPVCFPVYAECWSKCEEPDCPYLHRTLWYRTDKPNVPYNSEQDALEDKPA